MIFKSRVGHFSFFLLAIAGLQFSAGFMDFQHSYASLRDAGIPWWYSSGGASVLTGFLFFFLGVWEIISDMKKRIEVGEDSIELHAPLLYREVPYSALKKVSLISPEFKDRSGVRFDYLDRKQANRAQRLFVYPVDRAAFLSELEARTKFFPIGEQLPISD